MYVVLFVTWSMKSWLLANYIEWRYERKTQNAWIQTVNFIFNLVIHKIRLGHIWWFMQFAKIKFRVY